MGTNGSTATFQSNTLSSLGLSNHTQSWQKDKASADVLGLEWAALQGKYYEGGVSVKYVTKGSVIACDCGSFFTRIDLAEDHGIEVKSNHLPIMTTLDFGSQNISPFGICSKKLITATSEYMAKCKPQIMNPWMQNKNTTTDSSRAALLQADAFAVCNMGGLICIKEINKTPQESFMAILREQYGFDDRTAKIILELHQAIQDKYKDESQIARDWRFTRLLGGFRYALEGKEKELEVFQWNETAGDWHIESIKKDASNKKHSKTLKEYMMSDLGLSGKDYDYLQYKVRIQNVLAGGDAEARKYDNNGMNSENDKYTASQFDNMKIGLGSELDESMFIVTWNKQCDDMCGKGDFAHQQITTSSIFVTQINKNGWLVNAVLGGDRKREQMAGWLGDATIYGKKGEPPSFGNDDYKADLDAENIGDMVRSGGVTYIEAVEDYYGSRLLEKNRAKWFMMNHELEDIKRAIYDLTVFLELVDKKSYTNSHEEFMRLDELYKYENEASWLKILKDIAPDSYNFIRSLKQLLPEMGNF